MNYVAAFCLLVARGDADADADPAPTSRDDAERAYDAFRALTGLCRGYYVDGFPALHRDVRVFASLLKRASARDRGAFGEGPRRGDDVCPALLDGPLPAHAARPRCGTVIGLRARGFCAVDPAGGSDSTSAVLVHTLLAVVATAKDELVATDDFCAAQGALVRAARNTPSFEKLRRRAPCSVEAPSCADSTSSATASAAGAADAAAPLPLPPPPPAAPPTGILQNLRSWFENDEYATDTMRRPRLSPRPRRSARRSAGVELAPFAQRAPRRPYGSRSRRCSPAPVRGENPLSRWV